MLKARRLRCHGERGFSLVLMSLLLVSMLGIAGLVVDLGAWQVEASRMQQAADAAALGAVVQLPNGLDAAQARALEIAADNGYVDASAELDESLDVDVVAHRVGEGDETLGVTIINRNVGQYFTGIFRGAPTITRRSTAEYVQPVPMGSPRNYLGTGNLAGAWGVGPDGVENYWLAVSNQCTRREYGDRIAPAAMNLPGSTPYSCDPTLSPRKPNPEHPDPDDDFYVFGVTVPPESGSQQVAIQMFDAPVCNTPRSLATDEDYGAFDVRVTVHDDDALNPTDGSELSDQTFIGAQGTGGHCGQGPALDECASLGDIRPLPPTLNLRDCWTTLATVDEPGDYYIHVKPVEVTGLETRHDQFSLRAKTGSTFIPCTGDKAVDDGTVITSVPYNVACANVYGTKHLPVFASSSKDPEFYLASIDERHESKTMQVTLYDPGEGAQQIELLDPLDGEADFTWQVLCADSTEPASGACPDGDDPPTGGWGDDSSSTNTLPVGGKGTKTFPNNTQDDKYSDRLVRLTVTLPDDIGTATWWRIRYTCVDNPANPSAGCGDRTTWSVRILGDPVRLVPNPPPAAGP